MSCCITGNEIHIASGFAASTLSREDAILEKSLNYEIVLLWVKFSVTADETFFCITIFVLLKENQTNFQFGGTNSIPFKLW